MIDNSSKKIFGPVRWGVTFLVVNILWLLFRSNSIEQWWHILKTICSLSSTTISTGLIISFNIQESNFIFNTLKVASALNECTRGFMMNIFILGSFAVCLLPNNNYRNLRKISVTNMILAVIAFVWGITCLSSESVFVYYNF